MRQLGEAGPARTGDDVLPVPPAVRRRHPAATTSAVPGGAVAGVG